MAATILSSESQYSLPQEDRQKITSKSDNSTGSVPRSALIDIEQQRIAHVKKFGSEFG